MIQEDIIVKALPDYAGTRENIAKKDFSQLQNKSNVDRLLVIEITTLGFTRNYSS